MLQQCQANIHILGIKNNSQQTNYHGSTRILDCWWSDCQGPDCRRSKCQTMRRHLRQNDTNISKIHIRRPIYISDVRYILLTSDIYFRHSIYISNIGYPCPSPSHSPCCSPCPCPSPSLSPLAQPLLSQVLYIGCRIDIERQM